MPARTVPFVTNELYHILNRGNGSIPIFRSKRDYDKMVEIFLYYQNTDIPMRLSKFNSLLAEERKQLLKELNKKRNFLVEIITCCLMPNHFHFILKQVRDGGIANFLRKTMDSYSHYFNIKNRRKGSLFEGRFKAIRIETNEQLLHLNRYAHLNPYSSFLVKSFQDLEEYAFSSLPEYLGKTNTNFYQKDIILDQFPSLDSYRSFLFDQADYQRKLEIIKHQILE